MRTAPVTSIRRLQWLRDLDHCHAWHSCEELRFCIVCERIFSGQEIRISWFRRGVVRLHCATRACAGNPSTWVHPGNPLVSEEAWEDWERIIRNTETAAS